VVLITIVGTGFMEINGTMAQGSGGGYE